MTQWVKTSSKGIRYRLHPARKHGILPDRYFSIYFKVDGRQVEEGLGWASEGWTIEKAEDKRHEMKKSAKSGGPRTSRERRALDEAAAAAIMTVGDAFDELWGKELQHKKSGTETKRLFDKDVLPAWGKRKVTDIKRRDVVLLLDTIQDRGALIVRNRVHGALTRFFNFCAERGMIEDSPCTRIRKVPEKGRNRVLTDEEIKLLWQALDLDNKAVDIYRVSKLALKMILLTGQRSGEVCGMTWAELSEEGFWNIPAERMKNGEANRVPICTMAMEVIGQARPYSDGDYVFRSSIKEGEPMTAHALSRAVIRHWSEIGFKAAWTPHDLRRTVRTRMAEIGINDVVAERVLGHKLQGVLATYNRHNYDLEKRQALEAWERRLQRIVGIEQKKGKIVRLGLA
jgi:integrase